MENSKQEPRIRLNAKQNSKGEYQIDVTYEVYTEMPPSDIAGNHVFLLNSFKKQLQAAGHKIAGEGK